MKPLKILYTVLQTVLECGKTYCAYNIKYTSITQSTPSHQFFYSIPSVPQLLPKCSAAVPQLTSCTPAAPQARGAPHMLPSCTPAVPQVCPRCF